MKTIISVAMTSYNGEKYIIEQLESIRSQSLMPDEVIIVDDKSTDNTVTIVNEYIKHHHLEGWCIVENEINLGWKRNFFEAIKMTSGQVVFFSDQDDIWLPNKIEKMFKAMMEKKMGALFGTKEIIDANGNPLPNRMEKKHFSKQIKRINLDESFYAIKTLGCCMCVSREIIDLYLKIGFYEGGHDSQCGRLALLTSTLWYVDEPVIRYRIHGNNSSGIAADVSYGASTFEKRVESVHNSVLWLNKLLNDIKLNNEQTDLVKKCYIAVKKREQYLKGNGSILSLIKYRTYYTGLTMLIGDFSYKHHINSIMGKIRWIIRKR